MHNAGGETFREWRLDEVRRIHLPRTPVNKCQNAKGSFADGGGYLIVAAVALIALLPVVMASAVLVLPSTGTTTPWKRHLTDYVILPSAIAHLLDRLLINR